MADVEEVVMGILLLIYFLIPQKVKDSCRGVLRVSCVIGQSYREAEDESPSAPTQKVLNDRSSLVLQHRVISNIFARKSIPTNKHQPPSPDSKDQYSSHLMSQSNSTSFYHHYSLVDYLGIAFDAPVSVIGSIANLILIYCILCKTPQQLKTYSVLLFHDGLSNLAGCLMGFFTMIRCIPTGFVLSFVYHGPCSYFGGTVCYYATSVLLHCSAHTQFILVVSFSYRLYVLKKPTPKLWSVILVTTITYLPSLFQCITYTWAEGDENVLKYLLHETLGYDLSGYTLAGNTDIRNPWALFMILYLTTPFFPTSVIVLMLRRNILRSLKDNEHDMSAKTIAIHRQLTMALSIQACLPALLVIAAVTYGTMQLRIYHSVVQEDLVFVSHLMVPTISPIVIIYFMKSYRQGITSLFGSTKMAVYTLTRTKVLVAPQPITAVTTSSVHDLA